MITIGTEVHILIAWGAYPAGTVGTVQDIDPSKGRYLVKLPPINGVSQSTYFRADQVSTITGA